VIDGEIVAFDEHGQVRFDLVQKANSDAPIAYYVFDIVWKERNNLMRFPLNDRKEILRSLLPANGLIKFSESFSDGLALFEQAQKLELEGIVAKKSDGIYQPGRKASLTGKPTRLEQM